MTDPSPKTILITGAAGTIGRLITPALQADGWHVRGLDRNKSDRVDDMILGEITDPDAVAEAMRGVHTIIHLAAYPNPADFLEKLVQPNVVGLHRVLEAAHHAAVKRAILASSMQVIQGLYRHLGPDDRIGLDHGVRPDNHYGLTKVWAEQYGEMFARLHDIPTLAVRIGWVVRNEDEFRRCLAKPYCHSLYLSHGDCRRFFAAAAAAHWTGYRCVFAASRPADRGVHIDLTPAADLIGYDPQDTWPHGSPSVVPADLSD